MTPTTPPRCYTLEELLSFRRSLPVVCCLVKNINKHPDTAGIFKIPDEAIRRPEQITYKSTHLADITNKLASQSLGRKNISDSSQQSEAHPHSDSRAPHDTNWGLRRRDCSNRSSHSTSHASSQTNPQPQTAPTGLSVHRSENFQRFYRAVVSPTHVRVTAGGRIVPNTRSPVRPRLEWNSDQPAPEPDLTNIQPITWESRLPSTYPPIAQGSFRPQDIADMASQTVKAPPSLARASSQEPIKISPPNQFDQTKPFSYNGQLVYPVPHGFQPPPSAFPVPISMLGNPNFYPPPGFLPAQGPFQFPGALNPMMFATGQHHPMMAMPGMAPSPENPPYSFMPLPGVIAPAEFMQSQIQVMRGYLKQVEGQLADNKHQIDIVMMENQRSALLAQIGNMEALLRVHLGQEGTAVNLAPRTGPTSGPSEEQKLNRSVSHGSLLHPDTATKIVGHGEANNSARFEQSSSKSKLSMAAAMAPPFQPRPKSQFDQQLHSVELKPTSLSTSALQPSKPRETQEETEARPMAKATTNWNATHQYTLPRSYHLYGNIHKQGPNSQVPYLIGVLPPGMNAHAAGPQDLIYGRPLTEKELRARHLYWGKAPRSAQSGLPKFDGRDFYPPSPVKTNAALAAKETGPPPFFKSIVRPAVPKETEDLHFENLFLEKGAAGYRSPSPARSADHDLGVSNPEPVTQPVFARTTMPDEIDFTTLFTERGVPGYKSPPPKIKQMELTYSEPAGEMPVTPENPTFFSESDDGGDTSTVDSWMPPKDDAIKGTSDASIRSQSDDAQESESTVDIRLSPRANGSPPKASQSYDREDIKSADQPTHFLQSMLRKVTQAPIIGTPVSGTVSSATAQGYLPQYRGAAAASLAPAEGSKVSSIASSMASNYENRPLGQRNSRGADTMTAENYLRYVTQKGISQEDLKVLNPSTTGMGPVRPGEEW
ncbi:uncharacterized protein L3040_001481 [Drepanopeziza brunnea f. sp. 'multigermtubi']|uniref:Uncharacterized protein n=1 Tax=Marssonina brunnea f. sp. multigermtubi (strain MB_m1) TaxID=1072389 RepID=K1WW97_MARBU|nr:uncharacterized protein MBM_05211 [Drepanopeziza brunnea f. sp. 'multigermtubi' MB_m1]EKD16742.1 hypothetical protein MBM_05211 [Drepanopeziza brunnea f. sp. 'multigermtubi' MB_m1]KAJ5051708.1 hypothetical protein L3040_001481 [Drepanopeziza brunnea f. sp. 'multigermtubi']